MGGMTAHRAYQRVYSPAPDKLARVQAAMDGVPETGFDISATVFETFSGFSFSARSACETTPIHRSSPSTTGMRLIWCCCINSSQLLIFSPSLQVTGLIVKRRSIFVVTASRPWATTVQHRSRSVIMPTSLREAWSNTTGTEPTFCSHSILATFWALSSGVQQTGSGVMISRTFIENPPLCILMSVPALAPRAGDGFL